VWELTPGNPAAWRRITDTVSSTAPNGVKGGRARTAIVGLLDTGLPKGPGFMVGGATFNAADKKIYKFVAGGIIETVCGGVTGLTLGGGATEATFKIKDDYLLPWQVGHVLVNPIGTLPSGSIVIRESFDGGATFQTIERDVRVAVLNSTVNPARQVFITLRGTPGNTPCINKLNEVFEQIAGPGLVETVIRFNIVTAGVRYLYMLRDGSMTIETTAQMTTPDKCLLMKITPGSPPVPFDFVNKRLIHRKYTGTKSGADPSFSNDFPVLPAYIRGTGVVASGAHLYNIADPAANGQPAGTILFNTAIVVSGLTNGDSYIVELEA
jgi:hypothetical protein